MAGREVVVHDDEQAVADDGAARLLAALAAAQSRARARVGRPDRRRHRHRDAARGRGLAGPRQRRLVGASRSSGATSASSRPATPSATTSQAREALLDAVPLDPARVHPMASSTPGHAALEAGEVELADSADPDQGAEAYAQELTAASARLGEAAGAPGIPAFDVLLAGCGPEGHTLSVFPDSPAVHATAPGVVAVRDCPKPPPTRISLTLAAARAAREVWLVATGSAKAEVLGRAARGADEVEVPLAGLAGTERTLWLLDRAAADDI